MINPLSLKQLSQRFGGALLNGDCHFQSLSTDTRNISSDDLFVALAGPNFDAHDYLQQAIDKGCIGLVIGEQKQSLLPSDNTLPVWLVENTIHALGHVGVQVRDEFAAPIVAITGSSGKTTVKGLLASICAVKAGADNTFSTPGNLNNHIGVPLCLLKLAENHRYAVIEMGASAIGEIAYLASLVKPNVALVNNVMPAHVEGFGSIDAIAEAKGEIYQGLADKGVAIINGDDAYAPQWLAKNRQHEQIIFSVHDNHVSAQVYASHIQRLTNGCYMFDLCIDEQQQAVSLSVLGQHNIANALAAAACAHALNIDMETIAKGLSRFNGEPGRLQIVESKSGCVLINDSYNANPGSVKAAIDVLSTIDLKTVFVLGDMGELGSDSEEEHKKIGAYASEKGIKHLLTIGEKSALAARAFGSHAIHCESFESLINHLEPLLGPESGVLVKGSRSARLERVIDVLKIGGTNNASLAC